VGLDVNRTRHAAVTLASGDTLLVGGRSKYDDSHVAQQRTDLVSLNPLRSTPAATLITGRIEPQALRLSDGRVFVGGGYTLVDERAAEPAGEWLMTDGKDVIEQTTELPPRFGRAFVATPGGGVLAAGGCEDRDIATEEERQECSLHCLRGCPPAAGYDAWWLDRERREHRLPDALQGISAPQPILIAGSDGGAWLVAARASDPSVPRLFRFNPWSQRFGEVDLPDSVRLPRAGFAAPVVIDPDAFVWLDESGSSAELLGLRLGTRNRYTQDLALVLLSDPRDPSRPLHLVPDRPLNGARGERYDGRLWLAPHRHAVTVAVADTDYGDVTVRIKLAADASQGVDASVPPRLVWGDALDETSCGWPAGSVATGSDAVPTLVRRGAAVELRYQGERNRCTVPEGRLSLGLRAVDGPCIISELEVLRGATEAP
jgi:hypothetical protein